MEATDRWKDPSTVIPNAQLLGGVILGRYGRVWSIL